MYSRHVKAFEYFCAFIMGPTGFDSKLDYYVSMQSYKMTLLNSMSYALVGDNNYALAA